MRAQSERAVWAAGHAHGLGAGGLGAGHIGGIGGSPAISHGVNGIGGARAGLKGGLGAGHMGGPGATGGGLGAQHSMVGGMGISGMGEAARPLIAAFGRDGGRLRRASHGRRHRRRLCPGSYGRLRRRSRRAPWTRRRRSAGNEEFAGGALHMGGGGSATARSRGRRTPLKDDGGPLGGFGGDHRGGEALVDHLGGRWRRAHEIMDIKSPNSSKSSSGLRFESPASRSGPAVSPSSVASLNAGSACGR